MVSFDVKTASLEELKSKVLSNKKIIAFFLGMFIVLTIANVIASILSKKIHYSSGATLIFMVLYLQLKKSNEEIAREIKLRQQA